MSVTEIIDGLTGQVDTAVGVDYVQMDSWISIIQNISSLLLGLIVFFIIIGVPLVIALELMYINFPLVQDKLNTFLDKINSLNKGRVIGFIFRDAKLALTKANTIQTGKSVNWIYLLIKCKSVFIATFIVALVLGAGPIIIQFIVNIATSILSGFSNMNI